MQPVSDAFQAAVQRSHQAVCQVDIIDDGIVVASLPVFDGSVTADRTAAQMRTFTASLGDPDGIYTPATMSDLLAPFGRRAAIRKGVRIESVTAVQDIDNDVPSFTEGWNNGTIADPTTGDLILGWGS